MKALVLKEYNKFAYEDAPEPVAGPNEVVLQVKACGICGSDVHGMDGSTGRRRPPIIMGHEAAGVVAQVGSGVKGWAAGDRVTLDSTIYCGQCEFCRRGQINLCDRRRVLGVSCEEYRRDGAFAQFVSAPDHILYRLPDALPFEHAALVEPFAIALHAISRNQISLNDSVVVVGAGMIGLALVQALSRAGCGRLINIDIAADRLKLATRLGATDTINSATENARDTVFRLTHGRGADVSFEAVGVSETVELALSCLRKGGSATLVGNVAPKIQFPLQIAVTRELTIYGSCASRGEYPACLEMMATRKLDPAPLISAVAPLAEGASWFERLHRKEAGLLKVVLTP
jgi:threonine dehydrogenase-like Zn-dependent dehydrogenase